MGGRSAGRRNGCEQMCIRDSIVAALVRISVGSSTVAMTMAAGIISAMPGLSELSPLYLACVTAVSYTHLFYVQEYLALPSRPAGGPEQPAPPKPEPPALPVRHDLSTRGVDPELFPFRTCLLYTSRCV